MNKGHSAGRVVRTVDENLPYKVVLTPAVAPAMERSFATMREAEAFIRLSTPVSSPALSTLYDREAGET